jgi:hypothetical protein
MFALAQLLCDWCEQQPIKQHDLDLSVVEEAGRECSVEVDLFLI